MMSTGSPGGVLRIIAPGPCPLQPVLAAQSARLLVTLVGLAQRMLDGAFLELGLDVGNTEAGQSLKKK